MRNIYIGIMAAGLSTCLIFYGINMLTRGKVSHSWPECQGTVISSDIKQETKTDSYEKQIVIYRAHVVYSYSVNGKTFKSNRIAFESYSTNLKGEALAVVDKYPLGKTIMVYYDPANPGSSILEKSASNAAFFVIGIGCLCTFLGILYCFSSRTGRSVEDELLETLRMGMDDPVDLKKIK